MLEIMENGVDNPHQADDLTTLSSALLSSSTKWRRAELFVLRQNLSDSCIPKICCGEVIAILYRTYPCYHDRASRRAVQGCLEVLLANPSYADSIALLFEAFTREATKPGLAPSNAFVLVEWGSIFLQQCAGNRNEWNRHGNNLVLSHAQVLELCCSSDVRQSVKHSALVVTRRALRKIIGDKDNGEATVGPIVSLLTAKSQPLGVKSAVFLGVVAGVCARLPNKRTVLEDQKSHYYAFYTREIIGSRSKIPTHIVMGLTDFFAGFTTSEDLHKDVAPAIEKALLRAPEVVLDDLISPLVNSLPPAIDLTQLMSEHLLKPFLSNIKSQNVAIRNGAMSAFTVLISRCKDESSLGRVTDDILLPLSASKVTAAEQRTIHARMLSLLPWQSSRTETICASLAAIVAKEPNEGALGAEALALTQQLSLLVARGFEICSKTNIAVTDAFLKGMSDKRTTMRKAWSLRAGDLLWLLEEQAYESPAALYLVEALVPKLLHIFDEAALNPQAAGQSGLAVAAYVFTALWQDLLEMVKVDAVKAAILNAKVYDRVLTSSPKLSFLLNHRIYTKLSAPEDFTWAIRSLVASSRDLTRIGSTSATGDAWTQALLYLITAADVPSPVHKHAVAALSEVYHENPAIVADTVIQGLWSWYKSTETEDKDTPAAAAKTGNTRLYLAIRSICLPSQMRHSGRDDVDINVLQSQLINMLVLCRSEMLPRVNWIDMCLRVGQDPGALVRAEAVRCFEKVDSFLAVKDSSTTSVTIDLAAHNTSAELAFVAPDIITPLVLVRIERDLVADRVKLYGLTEIAIARTPEGTLCVDVLSTKGQNRVLDKNSKDYDTMKWEEEIRSQLAQKKGQDRKLTADEKAKVNTQLAKEAAIRSKVRELEQILKRGLGFINSLATGPPTEAEMWIGRCLKALLDVITAGARLIVRNAADESYLICSNLVSPRLGSLRRFVGVATLRALGSSDLPDYLKQEPLGELVTRTLYRLRFTSEQRPFDTVSLSYLLPLVFLVLRKGGIGHSGADEVDEQVTLALEFLSFHTDTLSDTKLPRDEVLSLLIESMQRFSQHYKIIKDCLLDLCRALSPNISTTEISTLLKGSIVAQTAVRSSVLQAVRDYIDLTDLDFSDEIWLACHDVLEENVEQARTVWEENALEIEHADAVRLLPYLHRPDRQLRLAASRALAECIGQDTATFGTILNILQDQYRDMAKPRVPERDEFGMPKKMDLSDPWEARSGIALSFKAMASIFDSSKLVSFVSFLIQDSAIGDRNPRVREEMIDSATTVIAAHGGDKVEELMNMFEVALDKFDKSSEVSDLVSEAVVILYGALARHLRDGDNRVPQVVHRLLLTLSTPSETVQYAVAGCMPPLIRTSSQKMSEYVQSVLDPLLRSKKYAARRGAAYGLAGIVSGIGISGLREYRIMSTLKVAIENKKDHNQRQGALFAYELLSLILGRIFEPYVIQIVPQLLMSFGDPTADVREACLDTSKTCFASLSSYGVKIILPTLLDGLEDSQWRSKKGACDLLGAMAYLDPQQLALSLPDIIPPLTNVLNDSHKEVRSSANRSLQRFGEVISNPEVKSLVGILLKALSDPTKYTDDALDALIKVSFIHYLDSPSLALIVRILERGLADRSGTKRKSAQIIGSLAHLTERKDVVSHLPILVTGLKSAVVDPVPATRATASKALGSLVEKLGEDAMPDLIPGLMSTLKSDTGAGDRLGSAQALSEVLAGLGTGRLEETLPSILQNVASSKPTVREGFMSLFIYLPACFGNSFAVYLSKVIPPILAGLADDIESIRETSLRAGRLLVKNFATRAIDLLLPELDRGLGDDSYRIRLSSVELVGDLLFNLTGISGKTEQDEEQDGAAEAGQSLLDVLGEDKRNKILSSLYICRCDTSGLVRNAAINVWKALVATPRTLKELVPTLTQLLIRRLASTNMEQRVIAGNALGELIRKSGEGVLASLLPNLEEGLQTSTNSGNKQGICIALGEIISSASPEALEDYEKTLISVVRVALVDVDDEVREAAAEAFDSLQKIFGKRAVDQVLPYLLNLLRTESEADTALSALLTLLTDNTRSNIILPNLVPTLLVSPITPFNARAIASLSQVAGPAMTRRLPAILNTIMDNLVACKDNDLRPDLEDSFDAILTSVDEFDGLNTAMSVMLALVKHDDHRKRAAANIHMSRFFVKSDVDYSRYHQDLIRAFLISFDDADLEVVKAAWLALSELTKRLKKEEMEALVFSTRQILQQVGVPGVNLPGFSLPKGVNAILPIFLQGLMNGTADQRTHAALAISETIDRTSAESLKPFVTQITGPLIRVVSERSVDVKCAILLTLNNLLEKMPTFLKPFLPQLQRTFAKSLADTSSELLRSRAAKALGTLITLTPRIDPLIAELVTGSKTPDAGVQNAMLRALYEVVSKAGSNMSEASRASILGLIDNDATNADDSMAITHARLLGALIKSLPAGSATGLIKQRVLTSNISNASVLNLNSVLLESPTSLKGAFPQETPAIICQGNGSKNTFILENCILAAGKYLLAEEIDPSCEASKSILESLAAAIQPGSPVDSRRLALVVIRTVSRKRSDITHPYLRLLAPPIFASVRDPVIPVKLAAEAAFLTLFSVVESENAVFEKYITGAELNATMRRSMQDYFKRVATRLGSQARERKEAEGGQGGLGLSNDEREDEREIWSVGKVDLGENTFKDE